ncbi:UNVERIFIED_CONTAM: Thaumatin-like protein [Sesamum radiatum]|uniref:Thaumatin-like protein n=1 Tax=Sesamum radiatum TaxID=300843 RepID=A0AAW2JU84_SESRA
MGFIKDLALLACILTISFFTCTHAATFDITNRCSYTVWPRCITWRRQKAQHGPVLANQCCTRHCPGPNLGPTNCNFDGNGRGQCQTGDCNGLLECRGYGRPPNTLAEFALNQFSNLDFVDISLVDGFNVPMEFSPTTNVCQNLRCTGRINEECPNVLRAPGGCNNPCTVFGTNQYCCTNGPGSCGPTDYSRFFKQRCPDAYSYPQDDPTSLFTCPAGTNYRVVFCP